MMEKLYPALEPYKQHMFRTDDIHTLYIEECGNPDGVPICFVHGGPGAGCESYHRQFFDPQHYRIILFDQRGCGRSKPHAELKDNTSSHLIADMEKIRQLLKIERWILFGGSWGSTLSLLYAQQYPQKVLAMILRGIFLCRKHELQWFYQQGASRIYPEYWQDFLQPVPEDERDDLIKAYYKYLTCGEIETENTAAMAWSTWEGRTATMMFHPDVVSHFSNPDVARTVARIECHYFINDTFIKENQILENMTALNSIPGTIIHGRYDMICPVENAWELSQYWSRAELVIVGNAGHAAAEKSIQAELVKATEKYKVMF